MSRRAGILIRGATMVTPQGAGIGDCRITDGVISELALNSKLEINEGEIFIEAEGLHLIPGCIDPQVHFREPGQPEKEDLQSGSAAAASGGVTSFLDMPNNQPAVITMDGMADKIDRAKNGCVTNFGFFIGATDENIDQLQLAVGKPDKPHSVPGICGIKVFMGSSTGDLLVDTEDSLDSIFANTAGLIAVHAEDEERLNSRWPDFAKRKDIAAHAEWRDSETALLATQRATRLAEKYQHRLHILHLTSGMEANWLHGKTTLPSTSSESGNEAIITTEVLPQHLTFDENDVNSAGTRLKMNPPIRYADDRTTLWQRLKDGTIQCLATDHAPHTLESKELGFPKSPSGMPGVETSLAVMLDHVNNGQCTLEDVVRWMSTNVADCYNMAGKGQLIEGSDGDVVLIDLNMEIKVEDDNSWSRVGWNPFSGRTLKGWPVLTIVAGIPVFMRNEKTGPKGELLVSAGEVGEPLIMSPWN